MPPCAKFALSPCCLDPADEILRSAARNRLAADQHHRGVVDQADRLEGGVRVVTQVGEQARRREQRDVIDQHRGAVGCRSGNAIVGERAAAADHVLDDDGLAERARHPLADQARHRIGAASGRIGHHHRHGLGGRLRVDLRRKRGQQETHQRASAEPVDHEILPKSFLSARRTLGDVTSDHAERGREVLQKICLGSHLARVDSPS